MTVTNYMKEEEEEEEEEEEAHSSFKLTMGILYQDCDASRKHYTEYGFQIRPNTLLTKSRFKGPLSSTIIMLTRESYFRGMRLKHGDGR
jgi:SMC interacting uncharacterized protein involved in chromosome segregation